MFFIGTTPGYWRSSMRSSWWKGWWWWHDQKVSFLVMSWKELCYVKKFLLVVLMWCWNSFFGDDLSAKGPSAEPPCSLGYEGYHMPELHMQFSGTTMSYPPFCPNSAGASNFRLSQGSAAVAENFPVASLSSKPTKIKRSQIDGSLSNLQVDHDMSSRHDFCDLPAESPLVSTITEDDFLEMVLCLSSFSSICFSS